MSSHKHLPEKSPLDALTGARFLAAFWVFNAHFLYLDLWYPHLAPWVMHARFAGDSGVTYFFLLSAFMMTIAYPGELSTGEQRKGFWIARFARLYPLYLLCFVWFAPFVLMHFFSTLPPHRALLHAGFAGLVTLFLVQDWGSPFLAMAWNAPGWTLCVDVLFYAAFPWLARWIRGLSRNRLLALMTAMWVVSMALSGSTMAAFPHSQTAAALIIRHPIYHAPTLILGMALGYLYQRRVPSRHSNSAATALTLAGLAGVVCMALGVGSIERWVSHVSFYLPAMAAVLYGLASGGWPGPLLRLRPLLVLGDSVYAFYLAQFPLAGTLIWIGNGFRTANILDMRTVPQFALRPAFYWIMLVCALGISILLFRFFETPWRIRLRRSLGDRWLHRPLPPPIIPGQAT